MERSKVPQPSVALTSPLFRRVFFAAHEDFILGYLHLLFIVRHCTKGCPGTETATDTRCSRNEPLGGDRRLVFPLFYKTALKANRHLQTSVGNVQYVIKALHSL